jgi:hypothetical protein
MELYALAVAAGIVLDTPLRRTWLLFSAFGLQLLLGIWEPGAAVPLWVASFLALAAFCFSNMRLTGMSVVAFGILLNAFVVVANGGMPVRGAVEESPLRIPEAQAENAAYLGEIVPLTGPFDRHVTFGDLIVAVGLVDVLYRLSRRPRLRPVQTSRPDGHTPPVEDPLEGPEDARVVQVAGG